MMDQQKFELAFPTWSEDKCFEEIAKIAPSFIAGLGFSETNANFSFQTLDKFCKKFENAIPFQNIDLLSTASEKRTLPTECELPEKLVSGRGGLCFDLNVSLCHMLKFMGLEKKEYVPAKVQSPAGDGKFGEHVVVLAHDLNGEGSRHLFDVGFANLGLPVVPLDFSGYSPIFETPFGTEYRFYNGTFENGVPVLIRERRNTFHGGHSNEFSKILTIQDRNPAEIDFFRPVLFRRVYGPLSEHSAGLPRVIRATTGPQSDECDELTFFVAKVMKRVRNGEIVDDFEFDNMEDQVKELKNSFPRCSEVRIRNAVNNTWTP